MGFTFIVLGLIGTTACTEQRDSSEPASTTQTKVEGLSKYTPLGFDGIGPLNTGMSLQEAEKVIGVPSREAGGALSANYSCVLIDFDSPNVSDLNFLVDLRKNKKIVVAMFADADSRRPGPNGIVGGDPLGNLLDLEREGLHVDVNQLYFGTNEKVVLISRKPLVRDADDQYPSAFSAVTIDGRINRMATGFSNWLLLEPHIQVENCRPS
jgi:hypothetical protein